LVELMTGLFLLVIVWGIEDIPLAIFLSIALIFLEIIFLFDFKYSLIPNQFIYPALILTLLFWGGKDLYSQGGFSLNSSYFLSSLLGSAIFSGFLGFLYLLTRGKGMGLGDVELGLLLGAILGWPLVVPALFFGFLLGAIIGLGLMVFRKKGWKSEIPFGPFLILGSAIAFIGGEAFLNFVL
jgi:leader peptidase (prepilin peptidase) / N-methyltransferase